MNVERINAELLKKGRFHWLILVLISLTWLTAAFNHVVMTFYDYAPPHSVCTVSRTWGLGNQTGDNSTEAPNSSEFPRPSDTSPLPCSGSDNASVAGASYGIATIVTEWGLDGERRWMAKLATTLYFAGVMIGGPLTGWLADLFGRKRLLLVCLCAPVPLGVCVYFMPYYEGFLALRFVLGIFVQGISSIGPVYCIEFFPARHKFRVILGFQTVWGSSLMLLALMAFLLPQWRQMQLAVTLVPAVVLTYAWWLPESPRWLAMQGRHAQLRSILEKAARIAGVTLDPQSLADEPLVGAPQPALPPHQHQQQFEKPDSGPTCDDAVISTSAADAAIVPAAQQPPRKYSFADMLRTPKLRRRSLVLFFAWFSVTMGYYGMTFNIRPVHSSRYLSFFFSALAELCAMACNGLAVSRFGRRIPLIITMTGGGVLCTICGLVASNAGGDTARIASSIMALFGRALVAASIHTLFVYASELFPTVIRSTAAGVCGFWMRGGSLLAPQLVLLGHYTWSDLPVLVIGGSCCIGGGLVFMLPETMNKMLPDSIADIEDAKETEVEGALASVKESNT